MPHAYRYTIMPTTAERSDPFLGRHFFIEIEGINCAGFSECSGLEITTETFEFKEGGLNSYTHRLPVRTSFGNITLKRGLTDTTELWEWYLDVVRGDVQRKNLSIVQYDSRQQEIKRWDLKAAYPVKWGGPKLNADDKTVSIETLEIAHHGLTDL